MSKKLTKADLDKKLQALREQQRATQARMFEGAPPPPTPETQPQQEG